MQASLNCQSIRQSIVAYFTDNTVVEQAGDVCSISLPITTIDGRFVDVFVEQRQADYFLVNDGGKAANELILQGVEITESVDLRLGLLAKTFGVLWTDETFHAGGKIGQLQQLALAVGTCSALAMVHLLGHGQAEEEAPMREQFGGVLKRWTKPHRYKLRESVPVPGEKKQHRFDFVAYPKKTQPIAFSILSPSVSALSAAERFAFKIGDLATTPIAEWRTVAVEDRSEIWGKDARSLVGKCANEIIELRSEEPIDERSIYDRLDQLVVAA